MADRVTLLVGKEAALVDRALTGILASVRSSEGTATRVSVAASSDDARAVIADALSPSLFDDATVLVVTDLQDATPEVDALLRASVAELPGHAWVVLIHPGVQKGKGLLDALRKSGATQIDCKELKGKELRAFLTKEASARKRAIASDAVEALISSLGTDLPMLVAAVSQLCSDVETDPIGVDDVRAYFEGVAEVSGFAISDATWNRQPVQALRLLRWAMQGGDVSVPTVMALASGLRSIVRVASVAPGASEVDIAREAGVPPWKVGELRRQWSQWSGDQRRLAAAAVALADADAAMKGGLIEGQGLEPAQKLRELERLVLATSARTPAS